MAASGLPGKFGYQYQQSDGTSNTMFRPVFWPAGKPFTDRYCERLVRTPAHHHRRRQKWKTLHLVRVRWTALASQ